MSRLILALLLVPILLACTGDEPVADGPTVEPTDAAGVSPTEAATPTPTTAAATEPSEPTEGPTTDGDVVDERLSFVLGVLNGAELDAETYTEAFVAEFREQVPHEQFLATLQQVTPLAPFTLGEERSRDDRSVSIDVTGADGTQLVIDMSVDDEGQIDGLLLSPGEPPSLDEPVSSLQEAVDRLSTMGQVHLAAATVEDGECTTDYGVAADEPAPIGSAFKLYVMGAVVDAVDAGELAWTDQLTITEEVKSLPSGVLQDREAGSEVTVAEAAELMISISDNTATDLLLHAVGRQAVEEAQAAWGHTSPELNVPFMTTRELFILKVADDSLHQAWVEGDEGDRRAILDDLADEELPSVTTFTGEPLRPDTLEWFASPEDLCRVLARLHDRFDDPGMEPLSDILTANPGIPDEKGQWDQILFKGGSEPGLVTISFLVTDSAGGVYALTGTVVNPETALDEVEAVLLMGAARDLLPAEG